ncbi:uncharacterized protein TrAtP1_010616 [Trichoderma atroviride]|uniref:uncharacterized protein n=1 Tax=Hypocrea atroviridis TaxID=63577 RepID=UPI003331E053|nr:hypothetical protein TrAtP1_010616 [Trichoderma atroviride]
MSDPIDPKMPESKAHGGTPEVDKEVQVENVGDKNIDEKVDHDHDEKADYKLDENAKIADYKADAIEAENAEHNMTVLEAVRAYPMASFWAFVMSFTIIMESYDVFLCNNFLALGAFRAKYGDPVDDNPLNNVVATRWQSALSVSGQLGALVGVCLAGSLTSWLGYRYATLTGLMLLNVFIFAFYYAESMPVIFAAQILEGIPWGIFIANAPAYCSEIVPIQLRAPCTQMLQMFWAIGSIVVGAGPDCSSMDVPDSASHPCFLRSRVPPGGLFERDACKKQSTL